MRLSKPPLSIVLIFSNLSMQEDKQLHQITSPLTDLGHHNTMVYLIVDPKSESSFFFFLQ